MGRLKNLARRVTERVARRVARDELFEKPGERAQARPLAAAAPPAAPQAPEGLVRAASTEALRAAMVPRGRALLIHHWATWCAPCAEELPAVEALARALADRLDVLGVSWEAFEGGGDAEALVEEVEAYGQDLGLSWPSLIVQADPDDFFEALGLGFRRIPQSLLLGPDGRELLRVDGAMGEAELARVRELLA